MATLTDRALASMWDLWLMLGDRSGGSASVRNGVALMTTGLPYAPCNQAIINATDEPDEAVRTVIDHFADPPLPFILQIWHQAGATDAARVAGLVQAVHLPLMILEDVGIESHAPASIEIRRADAADLPAAIDAAAECFELERDAMAAFLSPWMFTEPAIGIFVATHEDTVIGTALGVTARDLVGVFNVATLPRYRRRGIGEALTAACVAFGAEQDAEAAYLQASAMGRPVYERMGFKETGHHVGYMKR